MSPFRTTKFLSPLSVTWGDFNGDGALDLAVADDTPKVYLNQQGTIDQSQPLAASNAAVATTAVSRRRIRRITVLLASSRGGWCQRRAAPGEHVFDQADQGLTNLVAVAGVARAQRDMARYAQGLADLGHGHAHGPVGQEAGHGAGVYEAVVATLAEARGAAPA